MFKGQTTATTDVVSKCIMPVTGAFVSPLRIGRERTREGGRIVILHSTGRTGINTRVVAVLLYGALMRRKVAGDSADVVSGALERGVEVPGVGVGASTGCARIAFAGPNPNTSSPHVSIDLRNHSATKAVYADTSVLGKHLIRDLDTTDNIDEIDAYFEVIHATLAIDKCN